MDVSMDTFDDPYECLLRGLHMKYFLQTHLLDAPQFKHGNWVSPLNYLRTLARIMGTPNSAANNLPAKLREVEDPYWSAYAASKSIFDFLRRELDNQGAVIKKTFCPCAVKLMGKVISDLNVRLIERLGGHELTTFDQFHGQQPSIVVRCQHQETAQATDRRRVAMEEFSRCLSMWLGLKHTKDTLRKRRNDCLAEEITLLEYFLEIVAAQLVGTQLYLLQLIGNYRVMSEVAVVLATLPSCDKACLMAEALHHARDSFGPQATIEGVWRWLLWLLSDDN
jgi:hypothetical protein